MFKSSFFLLIVLLSLVPLASNSSHPCAKVFAAFDFPPEADYKTSDAELRLAIHRAYGEVDFYNQDSSLRYEDMHIDHVWPVSKGGPDNYFNYVPTSRKNNLRKSNKINEAAVVGMLGFIATHYAPKVAAELAKIRAEKNLRKKPKTRFSKAKSLTKKKPSAVKKTAKSKSIKSYPYFRLNLQTQGQKDLWVAMARIMKNNPDQKKFRLPIKALNEVLGSKMSEGNIIEIFSVPAFVDTQGSPQEMVGELRMLTSYTSFQKVEGKIDKSGFYDESFFGLAEEEIKLTLFGENPPPIGYADLTFVNDFRIFVDTYSIEELNLIIEGAPFVIGGD